MTDGAAPTPQPIDGLKDAIREIDRHLADSWDHPARLYALVNTRELLAAEPDLAARLGITDQPGTFALTPVEQEPLPAGKPLDECLATIAWPSEVSGCAIVHEVVALPPSAERELPDAADADPVSWAASHPQRREVRMLVGVLRDGSRAALLRIRKAEGDNGDGTNDTDDIVTGPDLVPHLAEALAATLAE